LCCGVAAPAARTVRCGLTGRKSAEVVVPAGDRMAAGKGRTSSEAEESVLLVLVALIAAIPRTRAAAEEDGEVR
jgi:hypothetical protein